MPYMARRAITLMRTRSHRLKIETGGWLKIDATKRLCKSCNMQVIEDEAHVALTCPAYEHIRADFQQLLKGCMTFADLLLRTEPSPTALGTYFTRILEHHRDITDISRNEIDSTSERRDLF